MTDCSQYQALLSGLVDQELNADEARRVNDHLVRCAACRSDYDELCEVAGTLNAARFAEPEDVAAALWRSPFSRTARLAGMALVIGGYAVWLAYALLTLLNSDDPGGIARISLVAIIIGALILFASVLLERLQTYRQDPYKEIER